MNLHHVGEQNRSPPHSSMGTRRVPWVQAGEEDIVWETQICWISVGELRFVYTAVFGIHHHFSPPFGRICLVDFFQASNKQIQVKCFLHL